MEQQVEQKKEEEIEKPSVQPEMTQQATQQPGEENESKWWIWVIALLVVLAGVGSYFLFFK